MFRRIVVAAVVALFLLPLASRVDALGLGEITVRSGLNQPLDAEIGVLSPRGIELDSMRVRLASPEDFDRAGMERPFLLTELRFKVSQKRDGQMYVEVKSERAVREPFLDFLLELSWPTGKVLREYTVLLDPPTFSDAAPPPVQRPTASRTTSPGAPVAPPGTGSRAETYSVRPNDMLWNIALATRPDRSVSAQQMMMALLRVNPEAFIDNNVNRLRSGAILRIPDYDEATRLDRREAAAEFGRQTTAWRQGTPAARAVEQPPKAPVTRVPEAPKETEDSESVATTAPPQPRLELLAPDTEAQPEPEPPTTAAVEAEAAPDTPAAPQPEMEPAPDAADQPADTGPPAETVAEAAAPAVLEENTRQDLALAVESVEALSRENRELRERFADLEAQMEKLQKLLTLKTEELALAQPQPAGLTGADAVGDNPWQQWQQLFRDPISLGVLALALLVLISVVWALARRRRPEPEPAAALGTHLPPEQPAHWTATAPGVRVDATQAAPQPTRPRAAPRSPDPLAEAERLVAAGKVSQAEEVLVTALREQPGNLALRTKLLEVYYTAKDRDGFETEAAELLERVAESDPRWQRVAELGRKLSPGLPMFAAGSPTTDTGAWPVAGEDQLDWPGPSGTGAAVRDAPEPRRGADAETTQPAAEFDFLEGEQGAGGEAPRGAALEPLEYETRTAAADAAPGRAGAFESVADELRRMQLDHAAEEEAEAAPGEWDASSEFDLSAGEPDRERGELLTAEPEELDLFASADEVSTKLDLAQAYLDMGETEGARDILEEVLAEGNADQKHEAERLLEQLES